MVSLFVTVDLEDVTLGESAAPIGQVIYHQDKYDYDIGYNSDYQMMKYMKDIFIIH